MTDHVLPDDPSVAYHVPWEFRPIAYYQAPKDAVSPQLITPVPNVYSFAAELRKWMLRDPTADLPVLESDSRSGVNPYAQHASILINHYREVTNDSAALPRTTASLEPSAVQLRRTRTFSELVLYTTRVSEALIKQLLFCTDFPHAWYRKAPLGRLLSQWCQRCPRAGRPAHRVSLLGSLAHRYRFCTPFEKCLEKDLPWLKQLRDRNAAHATIWDFRVPKSRDTPLQRHLTEARALGERFLHVLQHIADIEAQMIGELRLRSFEFPFGPAGSNLISTFHFQTRVRRLAGVLRVRASSLKTGACRK